MYEENLWTRQYKNASLEQIYHNHTDFIERVNQVYNVTDCFYPVLNVSSIVEYWSENGTNMDNRFHVPVVPSVILANAHVNYFWMKFSNWTRFKESNMLDVLIDDAIPSLQLAAKQFWNDTNTEIFFGFLKNVDIFATTERDKLIMSTKVNISISKFAVFFCFTLIVVSSLTK